jgi:hypothetical protein
MREESLAAKKHKRHKKDKASEGERKGEEQGKTSGDS